MATDLSRIDILTIVIVFAILVAATVAFWPLLDVVILSLSLAVILLPLQRRFSMMMKEEVSAILISVLVFLGVVGIILFTGTVLVQNSGYLAEIYYSISSWLTGLEADIPALIPPETISSWIESATAAGEAYATSLLKGVFMLVVKAIIFFLAFFMFIYRADVIWNEVFCHLPDQIIDAARTFSDTVVNTLYAIYVVHFSTSLITFVLALPFFWVLGYDHIVFLALMAGIFQLVPIIGPSILMLFLGIYSISIGDMRGLALLAVVGYPVVCAFPDIYLRPMMMGKRAAIHPVLMWIGFFGGLAVMGILGFILGPLFVALGVAGYHIIIQELKKAGESSESCRTPPS